MTLLAWEVVEKQRIAITGQCPYGNCTLSDRTPTPQKLEILNNADLERCRSGAIGIYGQWYTEDELYAELMKDSLFWGKEGGVTFSGGESLLQWASLEGLAEQRKTTLRLTPTVGEQHGFAIRISMAIPMMWKPKMLYRSSWDDILAFPIKCSKNITWAMKSIAH